MAELYIGNTQISGSGGGSADMSNYYNKTHIDTSISALDASVQIATPVYTTLYDYNDLVDDNLVDANKLYVITDLADADDLADFVTNSDLNNQLQSFNTSLEVIANSVISDANTSIGYWKNSIVSTAQSDITSAKNTAVSLVQAAAQAIPNFVVMTESAYNQITPDSSTIYFITD